MNANFFADGTGEAYCPRLRVGSPA
jgi:hypothetical protein